MRVLEGKSVFSGIAIGKISILQKADTSVKRTKVEDPEAEITRVQEAKEKGWTPQGEYYDRLTKSFGKASDCVQCGQCEGVCPQHLPIIENLKKVAAYFEK